LNSLKIFDLIARIPRYNAIHDRAQTLSRRIATFELRDPADPVPKPFYARFGAASSVGAVAASTLQCTRGRLG